MLKALVTLCTILFFNAESSKELLKLFIALDKDNSGSLSIEEFVAFALSPKDVHRKLSSPSSPVFIQVDASISKRHHAKERKGIFGKLHKAATSRLSTLKKHKSLFVPEPSSTSAITKIPSLNPKLLSQRPRSEGQPISFQDARACFPIRYCPAKINIDEVDNGPFGDDPCHVEMIEMKSSKTADDFSPDERLEAFKLQKERDMRKFDDFV